MWQRLEFDHLHSSPPWPLVKMRCHSAALAWSCHWVSSEAIKYLVLLLKSAVTAQLTLLIAVGKGMAFPGLVPQNRNVYVSHVWAKSSLHFPHLQWQTRSSNTCCYAETQAKRSCAWSTSSRTHCIHSENAQAPLRMAVFGGLSHLV